MYDIEVVQHVHTRHRRCKHKSIQPTTTNSDSDSKVLSYLQGARPVLGVLVLPGPLFQRRRDSRGATHNVQPYHSVWLVRQGAVDRLTKAEHRRQQNVACISKRTRRSSWSVSSSAARRHHNRHSRTTLCYTNSINRESRHHLKPET